MHALGLALRSQLRSATVPGPSLARPWLAPLFSPARGMRVKSSLKRLCDECYMVRRGPIMYVYCRVNNRHKQRQGPKNRRGWKRLYSQTHGIPKRKPTDA